MSNFQFLQTGWPQLFNEAAEAEKLTLTSPKALATGNQLILSPAGRELTISAGMLICQKEGR